MSTISYIANAKHMNLFSAHEITCCRIQYHQIAGTSRFDIQIFRFVERGQTLDACTQVHKRAK